MNVEGLLSLSGRVALVTGAGSGIGRATALLLARAGAHLVVAGRTLQKLEETAAQIAAAGGRASVVQTDVRREESIVSMVDTAIRSHGRIDIVVNNAGGATLLPLGEIPASRFDNMIALNLRGPFLITQAVGPHMIANGGGVFVNFSSVAGSEGLHRASAYGAAKSGVQMLTRITAAEWGPHNIRANCIAPRFIASQAAVDSRARFEAGAFDALVAAIPLRRAGTPRDVANLALFLASDASSYISGQTIAIDGGPALAGASPEVP